MRSPKTSSSADAREREFLRNARQHFRANMNWFAFEDFAFGSRSPLFSQSRSHRDVLGSPLYQELKRMWLELGVRQGYVAAKPEEVRHAAGRKTRGSRSSANSADAANQRNVAPSRPSRHRRSSKS
jgi:hypothetical protein